MEKKPEVWQRGPVEGVAALLQPVAHAILQAKEEAKSIMTGFPEKLLWEKPGGVASPAFHLQHIPGVIDRLFTYARKEELTDEQRSYLSLEGKKTDPPRSLDEMILNLEQTVDKAIAELKKVDTQTVTDFRGIGRKQIPTTVLGLYFHSAEHSMRHIGQLLVTVRILKEPLSNYLQHSHEQGDLTF